MYKIGKVLILVDLSDCSRAAAEHGISLARQLGALTDVLYVPETEAGSREETLSTAREQLSAFLKSLEVPNGVELEPLIELGNPRECILERAKLGGYDLLVMGTRGRTGRVHALAGSVAESVVRMAPCPVLTVRTQ